MTETACNCHLAKHTWSTSKKSCWQVDISSPLLLCHYSHQTAYTRLRMISNVLAIRPIPKPINPPMCKDSSTWFQSKLQRTQISTFFQNSFLVLEGKLHWDYLIQWLQVVIGEKPRNFGFLCTSWHNSSTGCIFLSAYQCSCNLTTKFCGFYDLPAAERHLFPRTNSGLPLQLKM